MGSKIRVREPFDTKFFWNEILPFKLVNNLKDVQFEPAISGITSVSLQSDSFLSSSSFQTANVVLTKHSLYNSLDFLYGLKENVIDEQIMR